MCVSNTTACAWAPQAHVPPSVENDKPLSSLLAVPGSSAYKIYISQDGNHRGTSDLIDRKWGPMGVTHRKHAQDRPDFLHTLAHAMAREVTADEIWPF